MRETVLPTLRTYDGFAGCIALYSAENGRAKGILLWESKEAAEVAEETLVERLREWPAALVSQSNQGISTRSQSSRCSQAHPCRWCLAMLAVTLAMSAQSG